jgi:hypothetical protein
MRDIKAGEEITQSYTCTTSPFLDYGLVERDTEPGEELRDSYLFYLEIDEQDPDYAIKTDLVS